MTPVERIRALREGGHVQRCHGIPHLGSYDVAAHSWHVVTLIYVLYPAARPPGELVRAAHFHDVAERWAGDIPAIAKWFSPVLAAESDKLEEHILKQLNVHGSGRSLSEEETWWLKSCDLLELGLWCADQLNLGNNNVAPVMENIAWWFEEKGDRVPEPVRQFRNEFTWKRTADRDFAKVGA